MNIETRIEDLKAELACAEQELRALEEMALARFEERNGKYAASLNMAVRCIIYNIEPGVNWCFEYRLARDGADPNASGARIFHKQLFISPGAAALAAVRYARDVLTQTSIFLAPLNLPLTPLEVPA